MNLRMEQAQAAALLDLLQSQEQLSKELATVSDQLQQKVEQPARPAGVKLVRDGESYLRPELGWRIRKNHEGHWTVTAAGWWWWRSKLLRDTGLADKDFRRLLDAREAVQALLLVQESQLGEVPEIELERLNDGAYNTADGHIRLTPRYPTKRWSLRALTRRGSEILYQQDVEYRSWDSLSECHRDLNLIYRLHELGLDMSRSSEC